MNCYNKYNKTLLNGFKFPKSFINFVSQKNWPDLEPWRFLCSSENYLNSWWKSLNQLYPDRKLIPFAHFWESDDVVCFDSTDISDEPKVYWVHAYASPGWEDKGYFESFDSWLKSAKEDAVLYKADLLENKKSEQIYRIIDYICENFSMITDSTFSMDISKFIHSEPEIDSFQFYEDSKVYYLFIKMKEYNQSLAKNTFLRFLNYISEPEFYFQYKTTDQENTIGYTFIASYNKIDIFHCKIKFY